MHVQLTGGKNLSTGTIDTADDNTMVMHSIILSANATTVNISPITTLIYYAALANSAKGTLASVTESDINAAINNVTGRFGFGIPPGFNPLTDPITADNVITYLQANEGIIEMARRSVKDGSNVDPNKVSALFQVLGADIADGRLDGNLNGDDLSGFSKGDISLAGSFTTLGLSARQMISTTESQSSVVAMEIITNSLKITRPKNGQTIDSSTLLTNLGESVATVTGNQSSKLSASVATDRFGSQKIPLELVNQAQASLATALSLNSALGIDTTALTGLQTSLVTMESALKNDSSGQGLTYEQMLADSSLNLNRTDLTNNLANTENTVDDSSDQVTKATEQQLTTALNEGDVANITVSSSALTIQEGDSEAATVQIGLSRTPTADVTVTVSNGNTAKGTVSPTTLTFTTANWENKQNLTIKSIDDTLKEGNGTLAITLTASSTDNGFNGQTASIAVTILDNEKDLNTFRLKNDALLFNGKSYTLSDFTDADGARISSRFSSVAFTPQAVGAYQSNSMPVKIGMELIETSFGNNSTLVAIVDSANFTFDGTNLSVAVPASATMTVSGTSANGVSTSATITNNVQDLFATHDGAFTLNPTRILNRARTFLSSRATGSGQNGANLDILSNPSAELKVTMVVSGLRFVIANGTLGTLPAPTLTIGSGENTLTGPGVSGRVSLADNFAPTADGGTVSDPSGYTLTGTLKADDADLDPLTYRIDGSGSSGQATITDATTGAFRYTANDATVVADVIQFTANDGRATSNTSSFKLVPLFMSIGDVTVADEGDTLDNKAVFTIKLNQVAPGEVTVDFATTDGSATAGLDYIGKSGSLTFSAGESSKKIEVEIIGDKEDEPTETFMMVLSNVSGAGFSDGNANTASATATIIDNDKEATVSDSQRTITIGDATIVETDKKSTTVTFTVGLNQAANGYTSVDYITRDGSASVADGDYVYASGTLVFATGQSSKTFTVEISGDKLDEANETFTIRLSNPVNARISDGSATGTIVDNDPEPTVNFTTATSTIFESDDPKIITGLKLDQASGLPITVPLILSGTATNVTDYQLSHAEAVFLPGNVTPELNANDSFLTFTPVKDGESDDGETVIISMGTPRYATPGTTTHTVILKDLPPLPVARTGQTESILAGDDGNLQKGVELPSPRFTNLENGTILDALTGLIWLKHANCKSKTALSKSEEKMTWIEALAFVQTLKTGDCGNGSSDAEHATTLGLGLEPGAWRLPNVRELQSLIDAERAKTCPELSKDFPFYDVQCDHYWTSTTVQRDSSQAWGLQLGSTSSLSNQADADNTFDKETTELYVWAVKDAFVALYDAPVAKTGQTTCYDPNGATAPCATKLIESALPADPIDRMDNTCYRTDNSKDPINPVNCFTFGQDGAQNRPDYSFIALIKEIVWPTVRFTDAGDGTVIDNHTGLVWLKNANCFNETNWETAVTDTHALASGSCGLSDESAAREWRLANRQELLSLIDFGQDSPALPVNHPFENVQNGRYWTSTRGAVNPDKRGFVDLASGLAMSTDQGDTYFAWPVRNKK